MSRQLVRGYVLSLIMVGAAAAATDILAQWTGGRHLTSILLASLIFTAYRFGAGPSCAMAVLATPTYMAIVGARNPTMFLLNTVVVFVGSALLISFLVGRVRTDLAQSQRRERMLHVMLAATREFGAAGDEACLRRGLAAHLAEAADCEVLVRGSLAEFCEEQKLLSPARLEMLLYADERMRGLGRLTRKVGPWRVRWMIAGERMLGVVAWRRGDMTADQQMLLELLVDTAALAMDRLTPSPDPAARAARSAPVMDSTSILAAPAAG